MTGAAGVKRTGADLDDAAARLAEWAAALTAASGNPDRGEGLDQAALEDRNLLLAARLLVAAARKRTGSVGAHYRADSARTDFDRTDSARTDSALAGADPAAGRPALLAAPARSTPPAGAHGHRHATASRPKQRISS
jgi:L-aspartate oxidase